MKSLATWLFVHACIALALLGYFAPSLLEGADDKHQFHCYEIQRFSRTYPIAKYRAIGPPWFDVHPNWNYPRINMIRFGRGVYRETVLDSEAWLVDEVR